MEKRFHQLASLPKQELSAKVSKQTYLPLTDTINSIPVQVDLAVQAPSLTELVTLPKPTQVQLDTSQVSTELVIGPKKEKTSLDKTFVVVLKHTVQIMPGITKWIDVQVQEQPSIIDSRTDVTPCSTTDTKESPAQCTEHSIGQHPCSDQSGQTWTNLQLSFLPNCLPIVVPDENMIMNEQCDFADGICNGQEFSKVPLMNWGTQPQVFRKGTVIGHLEQASIATYDDPIWKDYWEELPYSDEGIVRICQSKNRLEQLQQQIKISDRCSETERQQLLECLLGNSEVFALSDEELGETDVVEHSIDTSTAKPVKEPPRRLRTLCIKETIRRRIG